MRALALPMVLACASTTIADRLIEIPVGKKIPFGIVRAEAMFDLRSSERNRFYLGVGLSTQFDLEVMTDRLDLGDRLTTFDASYIFTTAIPDLTPGISFGVKDALDETPERRRFYAAITYRIGADGDVPLEVTVGGASNSRQPIFAGASLPLLDTFRLLAEHDSRKLTAGLELVPVKGTALRLLFRQDRTLVSLSHARRF